jgi:hypothetical protein
VKDVGFLGNKPPKHWCGRWESNPHEEKSPEDFHTDCGFRRPDAAFWNTCVRFAVWTIPSPSPAKRRGLGAARLVSTPSPFSGAWLGIATKYFEVSPNLSSSASPVSRRALKFCLSPQRLPFRHARTGWLPSRSLSQGGQPEFMAHCQGSQTAGTCEFRAGFWEPFSSAA